MNLLTKRKKDKEPHPRKLHNKHHPNLQPNHNLRRPKDQATSDVFKITPEAPPVPAKGTKPAAKKAAPAAVRCT